MDDSLLYHVTLVEKMYMSAPSHCMLMTFASSIYDLCGEVHLLVLIALCSTSSFS